MRYIKYGFWAIVGIVLLTVAIANRDPVTIRALPEGLSAYLGWGNEVTLPLFLVILGGVVVGLLIGFTWEWLREHKHRAQAARKTREVGQLEREVKRLKDRPEQQDDVLALLEDAERAR